MRQRIRLSESDIHNIIKESVRRVLNEAGRRNMTRIRITSLADMGRNKEMIMDRVLMLRHARNVGDEENVNNTVLSALRRNSSLIKFEVIG